jgi:hypothetical protein
VISFVDRFIDSLGGLQGVLTGVGAILLKTFSTQAVAGI